MTNYEKQFDAIIAEGRVFYRELPDSEFFRYLFANIGSVGVLLDVNTEDDPVLRFFKSVAPKVYDPEAYAKEVRRHMVREIQFLDALGGIVWTGPAVEGYGFLTLILPSPEVLGMALETAEGREMCVPYKALSVDEIRALRHGYRMADSYAEEMRTRREKTLSDL